MLRKVKGSIFVLAKKIRMTNTNKINTFACPLFLVDNTSEKIIEHYHSDFVLLHAISGRSECTIAGEKIRFGAGDYVLLAPNNFSKIHIFPDKDTGTHKGILIRISEEEIRKYFLHNKQAIKHGGIHKTEPYRLLPPHPLLQGLFASVEICLSQGYRYDSETMILMKLYESIETLVTVAPELYDWLFYANADPGKINLADFMNKNYIFNAPLERFAELSGRSLSTFRRDFIKEFGVTPSAWLLGRRLEEAYRQITAEKKKPSEIYLHLGFESLAHFTRSFKNKYTVTPASLLR